MASSETDEPVADAGAVKNTALQFGAQLAGLVFTSVLTLYLVRALGARSYGVYSIAMSIGSLSLFPALGGVPFAIARFLAEHRHSTRDVRHIYRMGLRLQLPAALIVGVALFALAGVIAHAYGTPRLLWPMRWIGLSVVGQTLYGYLSSVAQSLRRSAPGMWMALIESATETGTSIALVIGGGGVAGAAFGKLAGYVVAVAIGLVVVPRIFGGFKRGVASRVQLTAATVVRYASVMFVVDVTWSAIAQIDVILIGALLSEAAVGSFGAVIRLLTVVGYLGSAVSAGVAPRLALAEEGPDVRSFELGLRYLTVLQGVTLAPMVVWATPLTHLLLGGGYGSSAGILRALTVYSFVGAPAAMVTVAVNYLGASRRRLIVMVGTLTLGVIATYALVRTIGVIGAAVADDLMMIVYVGAHFWICKKLIALRLASTLMTLLKTIVAAAAMAVVLFAIGTGHLSVIQWLAGAIGGFAAYLAALLVTGETSYEELRRLGARARALARAG